jgi:hypothetical protein
MKHALALLLFLGACQTISAQPATLVDSASAVKPVVTQSLPATINTDYKNTRYWQRHKVQKLAGGLSLGVGLASLAVCGLVYAIGNSQSDGISLGTMGAVWIGGSSAVSLASIPLFFSAHKNKKKAKALVAGIIDDPKPSTRDWKTTGLRYELMGGITWPMGQGLLGDERLG